MRGFLAVLGREIAERRLLFAAALFAGLFPLAAPWMPTQGGIDTADLRNGMAVGLAAIGSAVLALVLGSSILARDLGERRLSFYFARPLTGWAIWAGKMSAAALLALGFAVIALLPALLVGELGDDSGRWDFLAAAENGLGIPNLFTGPIAVLLLLVGSHAVSVMVRSRSTWLIFDLAALALIIFAGSAIGQSLWEEGASIVLLWLTNGAVLALLLGLAIASFVQVTRGRTDLRRSHRLLSLTLWGLLGAMTLGAAAYARWVLAVTPTDLVRIADLKPAPAGTWVTLRGHAVGRGGYDPTFLLDLASGRFHKVGKPEPPFGSIYPELSRDGSRAVWLKLSGRELSLTTLDLRRPGARPVRTPISYPRFTRHLELSPDGRRVAALALDRLTVDDLETGRLLASVSMAPYPYFGDRLRFRDSGHVLVLSSQEVTAPGGGKIWRLGVHELDIASQRITEVSRFELPGEEGTWNLSPDGRHAILRRSLLREVLLADLRTGRTISLPVSMASPFATTFLDGGRVGVVQRGRDKKATLALIAPDGGPMLRFPLPGTRLILGTQPGPGLLVVATRETESRGTAAWSSWTLDLRTGQLRPIGKDLVPVFDAHGPLAARLFRRGQQIVLQDPGTGAFRPILQAAVQKPFE